ncbi:hypothetical protein YerA41_049 [Yersinia phage YerA41]|nr:hypothetical protein YerA41_049 [Yersinia phage YerA41]
MFIPNKPSTDLIGKRYKLVVDYRTHEGIFTKGHEFTCKGPSKASPLTTDLVVMEDDEGRIIDPIRIVTLNQKVLFVELNKAQ